MNTNAAKPKTSDPDDSQNDNQNIQNFGADVARLLDIVAHALYTNHDVFLRELISNAADACDKLRYTAIQNPDLIKDDPNFRIHVFIDTDKRQLGVFDNGIGMDADELADNLGTIAKSGTAKLMEEAGKQKDSADKLKLIGQFGVGFYASYMVASHVTVISRKAGADKTYKWSSDGRTGFNVEEASAEEAVRLHSNRGTLILLDIKDEGVDFLLEEKIRQTVEQYSDHIDVPVYFAEPALKEGQTPMNEASALWTRSKSEVSQDDYNNFYKHITHGFDEPLMTSHWRAEGKIEFSALLFIPTMRPWDLYDPSRKDAVRLYVRRVYISDSVENLMYPWLRFVRGVIDSEDLPLNISRESLQYNPVVTKIRSSVTKRILGDLYKLSQNDTAAFETFWGQFGPALKEGLYDAADHKDDIFKICRFYSARHGQDTPTLTSLEDYVARMKDGQEEIYYMSGEDASALMHSPQLEGFKSRGIEVLLFTDTIDDFWLQSVADYKGKAFRSVTKGDINLGLFDTPDKKDNTDDQNPEQEKNKDTGESDEALQTLLSLMKDALKEDVDDVRISNRLTESPVCLIAPEHGVDMKMERILKIQQKYAGSAKPVLEINKDHSLIKTLKTTNNKDALNDIAHLLLDQARIIQGEPVSNPSRFAKSMARYLEKSL